MTTHAMATNAPTLVWFRDDLRLYDNPALTWATDRGPVVGIFIAETPEAIDSRPLGSAAAWFQRQTLHNLHDSLAQHGVPLLLATGDPRDIIPSLTAQLGGPVTWSRRYHQPFIDLDAHVKSALASQGTDVKSHPGYLLSEPWTIHTGQGTPYRKFTPFARNVEDFATGEIAEYPPLDVPIDLQGPGELNLDFPEWSLPDEADEPAWARKLGAHWKAGEDGARAVLSDFLATVSGDNLSESSPEIRLGYSEGRDYPGLAVTSRLSPYLRCGAISPRTVWAAITEAAERGDVAEGEASAFRRQIIWRDFAWHRLHHTPTLATANVQGKFDRFPWGWEEARDSAEFDAWKRGVTGVPLVDAGMRELWETGSMHNRVRMIVGSLLTKNLMIHWKLGEEWFWDTLVDADYASNPFNWQWVAGCGDDAAPYFRIFNPLTQAQKFDKDHSYQRKWIPEAEDDNGGYPAERIVDIKQSRAEALAVYESLGK